MELREIAFLEFKTQTFVMVLTSLQTPCLVVNINFTDTLVVAQDCFNEFSFERRFQIAYGLEHFGRVPNELWCYIGSEGTTGWGSGCVYR